jgi:hypothetical protein
MADGSEMSVDLNNNPLNESGLPSPSNEDGNPPSPYEGGEPSPSNEVGEPPSPYEGGEPSPSNESGEPSYINGNSLPSSSNEGGNSSMSGKCQAGYNKVTYQLNRDPYKNMISQYIENDEIKNFLSTLTYEDGENSNLEICIKKKCPDGNYATNIGKIVDPSGNTNLYGCAYLPDTTKLSSGGQTKSCKSGQLLSSLAKEFGIPDDIKFPDICVSLPQFYFPKLD